MTEDGETKESDEYCLGDIENKKTEEEGKSEISDFNDSRYDPYLSDEIDDSCNIYCITFYKIKIIVFFIINFASSFVLDYIVLKYWSS